MQRSAVQTLTGWGRFRAKPSRVYRPEKRRLVAELFADGPEKYYIPRGLGRSIGDAAINEDHGVVSMLRLDRFIDFDPDSAVLTCEGGTSLEAIIDSFLPRGYFLPVTPGTKFVTVGGAIASDVHGKNLHVDGAFSKFVLGLDLLTPTGEIISCSPRKQSKVFWATVGGMGLTGVILSARVRLIPVETAYVNVDYVPTANLEETLDKFEEGDKDYRYSVAWIDVLQQGASMGRSVIMWGNHALRSDLPAKISDPLALPRKRKLNVPFNLPHCTLNRYSVRLFNSVFYWRHKKERTIKDLDTYFYPLDAINNWNRMYGRNGGLQYQVLLPPESSREAIPLLLERVARAARSSFLAVLKASGPAGKGMLSFPCSGYTLGLDFKSDSQLAPFMRELDRVVLDYGGRLYLAKDYVMTPETFEAMYPRKDEFLAVKAEVDPDNLLSSTQSRRVGLTPAVEQR